MVAADLKQSRKILRKNIPLDFILLDLELPDGSGLDLMYDVPSGVQVFALTADQSTWTRERCCSAGCVAVLAKNNIHNELEHFLVDAGEQSNNRPIVMRAGEEFNEQYVLFLADSAVRLQRAWRNFDRKAVYLISHRIKGTAIHFGYVEAGFHAQLLTIALKEGSVTEVGEAVRVLCEGLQKSVDLRSRESNPGEKN
jgi:CheY-like chemotaxis protein